MAYIRRVGNNWKVEIRVKVRGQTVAENFTRDTEAEARREAAEREAELKRLDGGGFPRCSVRQLLRRFAEEVAPGRDGARWDIVRLAAIERRMDALGLADLQLQDFTNRDMAAVRRDRLADISPASVAREESLLKAVWAKARHPDWALTDVDPFRDLGGVRGSRGRARRRKAEWGELKRILRQLGYHPRQPERTKMAEVGLAMLLALRTTLRSQEVLQLSDDCIDLQRMVVRIEKHKTRYVTNDAKSVPLMPKAVVLLARKCIGRGSYFTVGPGSRDTMYRRARDLAGVGTLNFHDLKRTAVLMLKDRLTEDEMMAVTGNSDVEVLRRHYMTDTAANAANAVWRALGGDRQRALSFVEARRAERLTGR